MIMQHFERLSCLPDFEARKQLAKWKEYLDTMIIDYQQSKKMKLYKMLPFPFYKLIINIVTAIQKSYE